MTAKEFFLGGGQGKNKVLSTQSKTQQTLDQLIRQAIETGEGPLADIFGKFNEGAFNKGVAEPALKNFQENILPMIQNKFAGRKMGSGYERAINKAGVDFQSELAKLMYDAQQGQKQNQIQGVNTLQGKQAVENIYTKPVKGLIPGAVESAAHGFGEGAGKAATAFVAG